MYMAEVVREMYNTKTVLTLKCQGLIYRSDTFLQHIKKLVGSAATKEPVSNSTDEIQS